MTSTPTGGRYKPQTLTVEIEGEEVHENRPAALVWAWVLYGDRQSYEVQARATAWTERATRLNWTDSDGDHEVWVWRTALTAEEAAR